MSGRSLSGKLSNTRAIGPKHTVASMSSLVSQCKTKVSYHTAANMLSPWGLIVQPSAASFEATNTGICFGSSLQQWFTAISMRTI